MKVTKVKNDSENQISKPVLLEPGLPPLCNIKCKPHFPFVEVTLNYPRTVPFNRLTQDGQKALYNKLWYMIKSVVGTPIESRFVYENCKAGSIHLHGYLIYDIEYYNATGLVCDIAKTYLNRLPLKYNKFNEHCVSKNFDQYQCPSISIQCYRFDKVDRRQTWIDYLNKDQNKIILKN